MEWHEAVVTIFRPSILCISCVAFLVIAKICGRKLPEMKCEELCIIIKSIGLFPQ